MSKIYFSDGVVVNTDGPYRVTQLPDGWYLIGEGLMMPVENGEEGRAILDELTNKENQNDERQDG